MVSGLFCLILLFVYYVYYYTGLLPRFVSLLTRSRILYRITTQVCIIIDEIEDIIQDNYPGLYHY